MKKRILAWILLAGFLLLIANIVFIGFYRIPSLIIYLAVAGYFLLTSSRKKEE